jgi:hypothetical protein
LGREGRKGGWVSEVGMRSGWVGVAQGLFDDAAVDGKKKDKKEIKVFPKEVRQRCCCGLQIADEGRAWIALCSAIAWDSSCTASAPVSYPCPAQRTPTRLCLPPRLSPPRHAHTQTKKGLKTGPGADPAGGRVSSRENTTTVTQASGGGGPADGARKQSTRRLPTRPSSSSRPAVPLPNRRVAPLAALVACRTPAAAPAWLLWTWTRRSSRCGGDIIVSPVPTYLLRSPHARNARRPTHGFSSPSHAQDVPLPSIPQASGVPLPFDDRAQDVSLPLLFHQQGASSSAFDGRSQSPPWHHTNPLARIHPDWEEAPVLVRIMDRIGELRWRGHMAYRLVRVVGCVMWVVGCVGCGREEGDWRGAAVRHFREGN